jgi:ubiquinone/menaquinone biosynthesis C-methylase UbiE
MVQLPTAGAFLDTQRIVSSLGSLQGQHIADLGCGSGYFTLSLAQAVGRDGVVSAVDVMQEPLQSVQSRADALGLQNVRTVRADLEVLGGTKIPDASQDIVLVANVLFQSQKKEAILSEGVRMLKSGGRMIVIDWKKGVPGFGPPDASRTSENDLRALVESAGVKFERALDVGTYYTGAVYVK